MRPLKAITEGVQEQQHHYFMCLLSQHVPSHFQHWDLLQLAVKLKGTRTERELLRICILQGPPRL